MKRKILRALSAVIAISLLVCNSSITSLATNNIIDSEGVYLEKENEEKIDEENKDEENTVSDNSLTDNDNTIIVEDDTVVNVNVVSVSGEYNGATWSIDEEGNFVLTGNINSKDDNEPTWNDYKDSIKTAKLQDLNGLYTTKNFFAGCENLESFSAINVDSSKLISMYGMFKDCTSLNSVDLSNMDTSSVINMSYMFYECSELKELDVRGFDTSNVTNMACMFEHCRELKELDIRGFDTSNVTDMSYMFYWCVALEELDVRGFDTSNVTDMSYMFRWCEALEELDVRGFDTSNVTNMSHMFDGCGALKELDVRGFDTSNVTHMSCMFKRCEQVEELDVRGFDTSNVIGMSSMFEGCRALKELDVSRFDTSKVGGMSSMFEGCRALKELDVSRFDTSKVIDMSYMFSRCEQVEELDVSKFKTNNVYNTKHMFASCKNIENLDVSQFDTSNVIDMDCMFYKCKKLKKLDVSNFNTSKVTNMWCMFQDCENLLEIDLKNFDTSNTEYMRYMFSGCSSLKEIDISGWGNDKLQDCEHMFSDCNSLEYVDLSDFNLGMSNSLKNMFSRCKSLKVIDLSDWDMSEINKADEMFLYDCDKLKCIYAPKNRKIEIELPYKTWIVEGTDNVVTSIPVGDDSICLYVEGTIPIDISKHKITFIPNGGEFESINNPKIVFAEDNSSAYKIIKNHYKYGELPSVNKNDYKFMGWWTSVDGGEQIKSDMFVDLTDDQILYAHWAHYWKVNYDVNGGQIDTNYKMVVQGETYGELSEPTKEGYAFTGWYTEKEGGKLITKDTVVDLTGDITIYAHWNIPHTVTLDANGGKLADKTIIVYEDLEYGELPVATRDGYTFAGWYTEKEGGSNIQASTIVTVKSDHTLYAHWTVNVYEVMLDANGGKTDTAMIKVTYDSNYNNLPVPVRPGYIFDGWFTNKIGGSLVDNNTVCKVTKDHTLYAHWTMQHIVIKKQKQNISGLFKSQDIKGYYIKDKKQRKLASVSKKGVVSVKKAGTVTVTAYKLEKQGKKKVKVDLDSVDLVLVNPKFIGKNKTLKVNLSDSNNTIDVGQYIADYDVAIVGQDKISFKSTKESVATIDNNGIIKLVGKGKTTIKVIFEKNGKKVTVSFILKVS